MVMVWEMVGWDLSSPLGSFNESCGSREAAARQAVCVNHEAAIMK